MFVNLFIHIGNNMSKLELGYFWTVFDEQKDINMDNVVSLKKNNKEMEEKLKEKLKEYRHVAESKPIKKGILDYKMNVYKKEDQYYVQPTNEINPEYFVKFDGTKEQIEKIRKRYTHEKSIPTVGKVNIMEIMGQRKKKANEYKTPVVDNKESFGRTYFLQFMPDMAELENTFVFDPALADSGGFILSTAFDYNFGYPPLSVVDTAYTDSYFEFKHLVDIKMKVGEQEVSPVIVCVYYKGKNKDDVPLDVKSVINKYKLVELHKVEEDIVKKINNGRDSNNFILLTQMILDGHWSKQEKLDKILALAKKTKLSKDIKQKVDMFAKLMEEEIKSE